MENIGIYRILNTKNNKMYIGSSENLKKRKENHFIMLKNNKHHSIYLQRAFNKSLDKKDFIFEILENCTVDILLERENYYLNYYCKSKEYIDKLNKEFLKLSYNILPLAIKGFSGKHRPESILKFKMNHPNRKNILCYTQDGVFYKLFNSSNDAEIDTNISKGSILKLCNKKRYISKKYIFGFENDKDFITFIDKSDKPIVFKPHNKGIKLTKEQIINLPWCTKIKCTNLINNEILHFNSQKEACNYFNLQPCTINLCLKKNKPYRKKLLFQYNDIV
jgi:hypothetical protein